MAQLSTLTATMHLISGCGLDTSALAKVARKYGVEISENRIEFSEGGCKYSYDTTNLERIAVKMHVETRPVNFSEFAINASDRANITYEFTDNNHITGFSKIVYDKNSGAAIEYSAGGERWTRQGFKLIKCHQTPQVGATDNTIPEAVQPPFYNNVRQYAKTARCFKHIREVMFIIETLGFKYTELNLFAHHNLL